jgi:hypothetical protein
MSIDTEFSTRSGHVSIFVMAYQRQVSTGNAIKPIINTLFLD